MRQQGVQCPARPECLVCSVVSRFAAVTATRKSHATGKRDEGETQKSDERSVSARNALRMDGEELHLAREVLSQAVCCCHSGSQSDCGREVTLAMAAENSEPKTRS